MRKKAGALILGTLILAAVPLAVSAADWVSELSSLDADSGLPHGDILDIVFNILFWILAIFGAVAVIGFAISGILYLTAAGDDDQIEKAKNAMKWSIIGVIVGLSGIVILRAVSNMLDAQSF